MVVTSEAPDRRRKALVIAASVFAVGGSVNLQLPHYAQYARDAGLSAGAMSALLAAYVLALIPVLVIFGGISDTLGRRSTLLGGLFAALLATVATIVWPTAWGLALARPLHGCAVALTMGSSTAWLAQGVGAERAARLNGIATAGGFGAGTLLTAATTLFVPQWPTLSYHLWAAGLAAASFSIWRLEDSPPIAGSWMRLPSFPAGSGVPALAIGLAWSIAGIVVAVLSTTLPTVGAGAIVGVTLPLLLLSGILAQAHARRLSARSSIRLGAITLPLGVLLIWGALRTQQPLLVLLGVVVAGTSTHGYAYVGGLAKVTALPGSAARAVSGYFLIAYLGFGIPAVVMGAAVDNVGIDMAYGGLALLTAAGCALLLRLSRGL